MESTALARLPRSCGFDLVFGGASGKDELLVLSIEGICNNDSRRRFVRMPTG